MLKVFKQITLLNLLLIAFSFCTAQTLQPGGRLLSPSNPPGNIIIPVPIPLDTFIDVLLGRRVPPLLVDYIAPESAGEYLVTVSSTNDSNVSSTAKVIVSEDF